MDSVNFYKNILYSRFLYFVFPKKIIKLQQKREQLRNEIKNITNKYIGEVDERFRQDRLINNADSEIDEADALIKKTSKRKKKKQIHEEIEKFYLNINLIQGDT
jgi:uncharacterized coiled-coil DUF342 family protein